MLKRVLSTLLFIFVTLLVRITPSFAEMKSCTEAYFEGAYLNRIETKTGFLYAKQGVCWDGWQLGAVARMGADTRTASDPSNAIFNDNFLFLGGGLAKLDLIPGVRLLGELGYTFDLSKKIDRKGLDYRGGWMSYHEVGLATDLNLEIYSEGIYVHRYRNFMSSLHPRFFYGVLKPSEKLVAGPVVGANWSFDSEKFDYNRFIEVNYGLKGKWFPKVGSEESAFSLGAQVYGVRGFRTESTSPLSAYSDFRILFFGYLSIQ